MPHCLQMLAWATGAIVGLATPMAAQSQAATRAAPAPASDPVAKPKQRVDQQVQRIVAEQLGLPLAKVLPSSRIVADLGADSLDVVELNLVLESEFDIEIPDVECKRLVTIADFTSYLMRRLSQPIPKSKRTTSQQK